MAKIGLAYPVYKTETESGVIAEAIQADIKITNSSVKLYADNKVALSDESFQSGSITLGIEDLSDEVQANLLGHQVQDGEIIAGEADIKPYCGVGFYGVKMTKSGRRYRAVWFLKVQFAEPDDNNKTREETLTFETPVLVGTIMIDENGNWKKEKTFDKEDDAKEYLEALAGIVEKCTKPKASKESGTYTGTQSVTLTAGPAEEIYYTTNGTTPSKTNGTKYTVDVEISGTCALRAIAVADEKKNSDIATYEYIIS